MRRLFKKIIWLESKGLMINENIKNKEVIFEQDLLNFKYKQFLDEVEIYVKAGKGGDG